MEYKHTSKDVKRFWSKVQTAGKDECWLWTGSCTASGYGHLGWGDKVKRAHRVSWILTFGEIENNFSTEDILKWFEQPETKVTQPALQVTA